MSHPFSLSKREIPPTMIAREFWHASLGGSAGRRAREFERPNRFGYAAREFIENYRGRLHAHPGDISLGI